MLLIFLILCLQIREPFSIWSVVKSPMGLMLGFTLLVIFVMPKLMDNIGKLLVCLMKHSSYAI